MPVCVCVRTHLELLELGGVGEGVEGGRVRHGRGQPLVEGPDRLVLDVEVLSGPAQVGGGQVARPGIEADHPLLVQNLGRRRHLVEQAHTHTQTTHPQSRHTHRPRRIHASAGGGTPPTRFVCFFNLTCVFLCPTKGEAARLDRLWGGPHGTPCRSARLAAGGPRP